MQCKTVVSESLVFTNIDQAVLVYALKIEYTNWNYRMLLCVSLESNCISRKMCDDREEWAVFFIVLFSAVGLSRSFYSAVVMSLKQAWCKCQVSIGFNARCKRESLSCPSTVTDHCLILVAFRFRGKCLINVVVQNLWAGILLVVWDKLQERRERWNANK